MMSVCLSERTGDCVPKDQWIFAVSHRILVELRISDLKAKNQRQIIPIFLSESTSDCTLNSQRLFAVTH